MIAGTCTAQIAQIRSSSRERILEAATHLFAANGFEYTSTLSIARAAGTSETRLLKKFTDKQGLLEAVFAQVLEKMSALLQDARHLSSPRDQVRQFFLCALSWLYENPELGKMLLLDMRRIRAKNGGEVLSPPKAVEVLQEIDHILEEAGRAGQLKCTMHPYLIRSALFGAIGELLRDSLIAQEPPLPGVTPQDVDKVLDYLLCCFFV